MPFGGPAPEPTATTTAFTFYSGAASATWTPDYGPWSAGVGAWGNLDPAVLTGGSPAVIIAKNPAWALISPSSWISYADTTTNGPANGVTVTFTVDFLLPAGATSPTVSVSALGDDSVTVSLNGNAFGPSPLASYATVGTASTSDASLFHTGSDSNQLQFLVAQTGGDGFGLDFSATITFTAASGPVAAFSWTPTVPEEGIQFQITDLSTDPDNDIVKREWDFGDGTGIAFNTLTHPSHTYGHAGNYTVKLTVTDASGQSNAVSHDITVSDVAPTAVITTVESFTLTQGGVTVPIELSFGTSDASIFYQYYGASSHMGFETAFQSNMLLHRQTTTGNLSLIFTHNIDRDSSGQATGIGEVSLDLSGIPAGAFVNLSDDPSHCWDAPRCQEFSLAYSLEGQWMYIDNTDGGILRGLPTASAWCITVSPVHFSNINSWVYYSNGVDVNLAMNQNATLCSTPQVDVGQVIVAEGEEVSLRGFFDDPSWLDSHTAVWDWGDGTVVAAAFSPGTGATHHNVIAATHAYGRAGTYTATLTVTDDLGMTGTDSVQVVVTNVGPTASISGASPNPVQGGQPVTFDGFFDDPSFLDVHTATWDFGDGATTAGTFSPGVGSAHHEMDAIDHVFPAAGVYTVTPTVCDDFGGWSRDPMIVGGRKPPP